LAAPVLRKVQLVTGSVQPILDVLNARVPGLSDIGFGDITLKDLAKLAAKIPGALPPDIDALINLTATVADIVSTINKVDVKDKAVSIPFGDFEVGGDKGKNLRSLPTPTVPGDLTDLIPNVLKGF